MFRSPGGLGLAPITLVLFIAFAQSPCSVVTIAPLSGREARKDVGCPLHGAIRVKMGYSGSNKMIDISVWFPVVGCAWMYVSDRRMGPPGTGRWVFSRRSEASICPTLYIVREAP